MFEHRNAAMHHEVIQGDALKIKNNKTLRSVHFGVLDVELIKCKCGGIVKNEIC